MGIRWGRGYFRLWIVVSLAWGAIVAAITISTITSLPPPASVGLHCAHAVQQNPARPSHRPIPDGTNEHPLSVVNAYRRADQECTAGALIKVAALQAEQKRNSIQEGIFALLVLPLASLAIGLTLARILKGFGPQRLTT